jgi:hypothetical protein
MALKAIALCRCWNVKRTTDDTPARCVEPGSRGREARPRGPSTFSTLGQPTGCVALYTSSQCGPRFAYRWGGRCRRRGFNVKPTLLG